MTNKVTSPNPQNKYDLEERTARFGETIIKFAGLLPKNPVTLPIISQLIRSGTSVGANYMEADAASTKKDFKYKLALSRKESKEAKHWLRMVSSAVPEKAPDVRLIWKEAQELVFIFFSILNR
mgnify:CR=1 FL=1